MPECIIVNITGAEDWAPEDGRVSTRLGRGKPTRLQPNVEAARIEAARLAIELPGDRFAIFALTDIVEARTSGTPPYEPVAKWLHNAPTVK